MEWSRVEFCSKRKDRKKRQNKTLAIEGISNYVGMFIEVTTLFHVLKH